MHVVSFDSCYAGHPQDSAPVRSGCHRMLINLALYWRDWILLFDRSHRHHTTTRGGRLIFHIFGAPGQFERDIKRISSALGNLTPAFPLPGAPAIILKENSSSPPPNTLSRQGTPEGKRRIVTGFFMGLSPR